MDMNSLAQQRNELKSKLSRIRVVLHVGKYTPVCAHCGLPIYDGKPDMHEVFLTRGDINDKSSDLLFMIMVRYNCVLLHHKCHHLAGTMTSQVKCIKHLIRYEGYDKIRDWLEELNDTMKGRQAEDALRLLKEVYYDPKNMWNLRPASRQA